MEHLKTFRQINESWDDSYESDLARYIEDNLGRKAKSMYDPWIPVKILSMGGTSSDKYVILVVAEGSKHMKTLVVDDLTACRDKWAGGTGTMTDMNVISEHISDITDRYEMDGFKIIWENTDLQIYYVIRLFNYI